MSEIKTDILQELEQQSKKRAKGKKQMIVNLDMEIYNRFARICKKKKIHITPAVVELIKNYLEFMEQ